jgi:hypothetical protein
MLYIGIDPGKKGAICLLDPDDPTPDFIGLDPAVTPANDVFNALKYETATGWRKYAYIALEEVHSLHGMSAKSNFTFGGMFWRIMTILDCLDHPYELVQPKIWQQAAGIPVKKDRIPTIPIKVYTALQALKAYPKAESKIMGPRGGIHDGRADALMIAHYLRLKYGG